jgi:hypothetical protein
MSSFGLAALMPKKIPFRRYQMINAGFAKTRMHDELKIARVVYQSLKHIVGPGTDRDGRVTMGAIIPVRAL